MQFKVHKLSLSGPMLNYLLTNLLIALNLPGACKRLSFQAVSFKMSILIYAHKRPKSSLVLL